MLEPYLNSPCLYGIVINYLSTEGTLPCHNTKGNHIQNYWGPVIEVSSFSSPEDGNRSSFRNVVLSSF
jgi:hypothetical protein